MKKLSFRIAVLLCMVMSFSSVVFGQVPKGYTIIKTHNDDITWYEVKDRSGDLGVFFNDYFMSPYPHYGFSSISYSHGFFFFDLRPKYEWYEVFDLQGKEAKFFGDSNNVKEFKVVNGKFYLIKYDGVYDEKCNRIGREFKEIDGKWFLVTLKDVKDVNSGKGLYDLMNDRQIVPSQFNWIEFLNGTKGETFIKLGVGNWVYDGAGIYDLSGEEILAPDFQDCDYLGNNLFKFKLNGYWGVMNREGKIIIPLDRHYTSIDYSRTLKIFTFTKETETAYYKGECNANGVQTSIEKTGTKSKPKQQTQQPKQETKPQQPKQETKPRQETTPTPTPTPQPQPQPRPMQVWKPCVSCGGSGQCHVCLGTGHSLQNPNSTCILCNGTGKCTHCAGHGGQNVIEYH